MHEPFMFTLIVTLFRRIFRVLWFCCYDLLQRLNCQYLQRSPKERTLWAHEAITGVIVSIVNGLLSNLSINMPPGVVVSNYLHLTNLLIIYKMGLFCASLQLQTTCFNR